MAESTRAMRRSIYERGILPTFRNRLLTEITPDDLRMMCGKVKDRGAPATAVHVRDIVKLIFAWPAAGFVDTAIGCFMKPEVADAATEVFAGVQG
ncbi:hypothetical protein GCM10017643_45680 [Ancylobacter dichloromethanicus]|uniref:Phage integrase central domain-containing protein n=1 Tax=Ancylobacter dichloromethanicus TaxID=518825 RepID=A0A9W6JEQ8_9HYPH|nr:hypothetical protein GCM10017643_45680 [Ancylobacter dichloromethanicus]